MLYYKNLKFKYEQIYFGQCFHIVISTSQSIFEFKTKLMRYITAILAIIVSANFVVGQGINDAIRYSTYQPIGTARTLGVGSAFGAMGGDFSVIGINPAGIADYRKGELNITPAIANSSTNSFFVADSASTSSRSRSNFLLDNIGFVGANSPTGSNWETSNWAVGFSKLVSFNRNANINGASIGSITERFIELANGNTLDQLDPFAAGPAFDAGAILDEEDNMYSSDYLEDDIVQKEQFINQRGSINELSLAWAGNYKNQLNIGISAGIPFVSFTETKTYKEGVTDGDFSNQLEYVESLNTTGVGFNFKLGMQYRANRQFRVGAAIHSPTWYRLNDDFSTLLNYEFTSSTQSFTGSAQSPDGSFRYQLNTPWKAVLSLGSIYKVGDIQGFVSADIEFLNYTNNEFDFTAYSDNPAEVAFTQEVNSTIDNQLGSATNVRLGTELAYNNVRFRLGYSINSSPFAGDSNNFTALSMGLGFRADKFFIDLGYRLRNTIEGYNPYIVQDEPDRDPLSIIDTDYGRLALTIGFKF